MRTKITKMVVPWKLSKELEAAGIALKHDVSLLPPSGLYIPLVDETQANEALAVIEAHDGIDEVQLSQNNLKDEYQTALNTLEAIRDAQNMTNAQAIQAVQYIAKILIFLLKYLVRKFVGV